MQPKRIPLSALRKRLGGKIDLFICCGSFEARSLSVARSLGAAAIDSAIVAKHQNVGRHVAENTAHLLKLFGKRAGQPALVSTAAPVETADALTDAVRRYRLPDKPKILVDITTFTHESLLILVEVISRSIKQVADIQFVYTGSKEYATGLAVEQKWLSKGIEDIRSVLGYPGEILPGRPCHLILLHGFEAERSKSLIMEYEPDVLHLGRAEAQTLGHVGVNERVHAEVLRFAQSTVDVHEFAFSTSDPESCADAVGAQVSATFDANVVIAPMNTKLSALGVALAARRDRRLQVCYAQPATYNYAGYSIPDEFCFLFTLPELWHPKGKCTGSPQHYACA